MKVSIVMAITLDGKIGKTPSHYPDWTGTEDKRFFARISREAGVVIMGSKTFDTIGKALPGRRNIVMTRNPDRLSTDPDLVFTSKRPSEIVHMLSMQGYEKAILAGGAMVNTLFAMEECIDEIIVTVSPMIFGYGISLFDQNVSMSLSLKDVVRLGTDSVVLTYAVKRPRQID